jgi:hypothetical protein
MEIHTVIAMVLLFILIYMFFPFRHITTTGTQTAHPSSSGPHGSSNDASPTEYSTIGPMDNMQMHSRVATASASAPINISTLTPESRHTRRTEAEELASAQNGSNPSFVGAVTQMNGVKRFKKNAKISQFRSGECGFNSVTSKTHPTK